MKPKLKIEQVFDLIEKVEGVSRINFKSTSNGSKKNILDAENILSLEFPEDFKKFVSRYGGYLSFSGDKVVGLDTVELTLDSRSFLVEDDKDFFPESLIYVKDVGGKFICIDTSQNNKVVWWEGDATSQDKNGKWCFESSLEVVYESFTEFLFDFVVWSFGIHSCYFEDRRIEVEEDIARLKVLSSMCNEGTLYSKLHKRVL